MKTAKRKNFITRAAIMITICILAVFSCSAAFADGDWVNVNGESRQVYWRTYGNGNEDEDEEIKTKKIDGKWYVDMKK